MLAWFRARASRIAMAAVVSLATLGTSAITPHEDDCHDSSCAMLAVAHDADDHRVGGPASSADEHPLHCLVCHWTRTFRPQIATKVVAVPAVLIRMYSRFDLITLARNAQVAQPPLRSPPASPVKT